MHSCLHWDSKLFDENINHLKSRANTHLACNETNSEVQKLQLAFYYDCNTTDKEDANNPNLFCFLVDPLVGES